MEHPRRRSATVDEFLVTLREGAERLGLHLAGQPMERLRIHYRLLLKWNSKMNLTAISDPRLAAERLYLDSLVLAARLDDDDGRVHDVGSGAGFPGLVVKALRPARPVVLTEARRRKVSFLRRAASQMGLLAGLEINCARLGWSEDSFPPAREVMSRAAFPPREWLRLGQGLVEPGGRLWVFCGHHAVDGEEADERLPSRSASLELESSEEYVLPVTGVRRRLLAYRRAG